MRDSFTYTFIRRINKMSELSKSNWIKQRLQLLKRTRIELRNVLNFTDLHLLVEMDKDRIYFKYVFEKVIKVFLHSCLREREHDTLVSIM